MRGGDSEEDTMTAADPAVSAMRQTMDGQAEALAGLLQEDRKSVV